MSNIIFAFLGNIPKLDLWVHWEKFFLQINKSYKNNIYLVCHPINYTEYEKEYNTNTIKKEDNNYTKLIKVINEENIFIMKNEKHIRSEWGTWSLTDATLLMMQECLININNIKKFILVSDTCCPIYNINYIYTELCSHSKSYISGNNLSILQNEYNANNLKFFDDNNQIFKDKYNIKYSLYYNGWFILDIKHLQYFFIKSTNYEKKKLMYTKLNSNKSEYHCKRKNDKINIEILNDDTDLSNEEKTHLITIKQINDFFYKPKINEYLNGEKHNYCWPIDELYFGNFLMKMIIDKNLNIHDELMINNINTIKQNVKINKLALEELVTKYEEKISCNINIIEPFKNQMQDNHFISESDINIHVNTIIPHLNNDSLRLCSSTYVDWISYIFDPINLFREFKIKIEHLHNVNFKTFNYNDANRESYGSQTNFTNYKTYNDSLNTYLDNRKELERDILWCNFAINDFLNLDTPEIALEKLMQYDTNLEQNNYLKLFNNELLLTSILSGKDVFKNSASMPISWHPVEFRKWNAKNMVNSLVLMGYLYKMFLNNPFLDDKLYQFNNAYNYFKKILLQNKIIKLEKKIIGNTYIELPVVINYKNYNENNYGYIINPKTIIAARSSNCLFIRKCLNDSGINEISDILLKNPSFYISKVLNQIILDNLPKYGISIYNLEELTQINNTYRIESFYNVLNNNQNINNKINNLYIYLYSILPIVKIIDDNIIIKSANLNKNYKINKIINSGGWSNIYEITDLNNPTDKLILKNFRYDEQFNSSLHRLIILSFYDNLINIILSIIQKNISNLNLVNESVLIGIDTNKTNTDSKYIISINKKTDGNCLDLLITLINGKSSSDKILIFNKLCSLIFTKLFILQKFVRFIHNDLKLSNILYNKKEIISIDYNNYNNLNNIDILISDLGMSQIIINKYTYIGNPITQIKNNYFYKDILYFLIETIFDIKDDDITIYIINILKQIMNIELFNTIFPFVTNKKIDTNKIHQLNKESIKKNFVQFDDIFNEKYKLSGTVDDKYNIAEDKIFKIYKMFDIVNSSTTISNFDILNSNENKYYIKYLKYKNKYLKLKNN
jgi:hypothetical protein